MGLDLRSRNETSAAVLLGGLSYHRRPLAPPAQSARAVTTPIRRSVGIDAPGPQARFGLFAPREADPHAWASPFKHPGLLADECDVHARSCRLRAHWRGMTPVLGASEFF
jgi:hypothetical protein